MAGNPRAKQTVSEPPGAAGIGGGPAAEGASTRDTLTEAVLRAQWAISRGIKAGSTSWIGVDLTMAQLKTLVVLADEGPSAIGEVAAVLGVGLPTASHLVDRLVRTGLARRVEDPHDRRRALASIAPEGQELLRGLLEGGRERFRAYLRLLSDDDLRALGQGLAALARAVQTAEAERERESDGGAEGDGDGETERVALAGAEPAAPEQP